MGYRRFFVPGIMTSAIVSAGLACSGPDPGLITFVEGTSTTVAPKEDETPDPAPKTKSAPLPKDGGGTGLVNAVFESETYPAVTACAACHLSGAAGAPIFFGADAPATYPLFKQRNYHLPNSLFVTKGAHAGPALTAAQKTAVDNWIKTEGTGAADGGG